MKKPTLEEVKEYFKNAKEVRCLGSLEIFEINFETINEKNNNSTYNYWCFSKNGSWILLWSFFRENYAEIISYKDDTINDLVDEFVKEGLNTPNHYDNSKGTLYKVATERNWNPYLFDIVKRLERAEKKGEFKTDLEKSINVIKLWLNESE